VLLGECPNEGKRKQREMIFLGEKIADEEVWATRCKGCGEMYVIREVAAGETTFPALEQTISCHKTHAVYRYRSDELQSVWAP
jgi:hypothetical protein